MNKNVGVLLFALALTLAQPYVKEFCEWFRHRYAIMKRCQYRRQAAQTNELLYKCTKEEYYRERMEALRGGNYD